MKNLVFVFIALFIFSENANAQKKKKEKKEEKTEVAVPTDTISVSVQPDTVLPISTNMAQATVLYVPTSRPSEEVPVTFQTLRTFGIDLTKDSAHIQLFTDGSIRFIRHTPLATIENGKLVITNTPYVVPKGTKCEVKVFKSVKSGLPQIFVSADSSGAVPVFIPFQFIMDGGDTTAILDWGTKTNFTTGEEFRYFDSGGVTYEILFMPQDGIGLNFLIEYDNQSDKYARGDNPGTSRKKTVVVSQNGAVYEPVERSDSWRSKIGPPNSKRGGG